MTWLDSVAAFAGAVAGLVWAVGGVTPLAVGGAASAAAAAAAAWLVWAVGGVKPLAAGGAVWLVQAVGGAVGGTGWDEVPGAEACTGQLKIKVAAQAN